RCGHRDALLEIATLLMDPEAQTRQMAARAIGYAGHEVGTMLLRMKVAAGDTEPDVIAECFNGLMKLTPAKSLDFVAKFIDEADTATAESAAMAIGASRTAAAFELLRNRWERHLLPDK